MGEWIQLGSLSVRCTRLLHLSQVPTLLGNHDGEAKTFPDAYQSETLHLSVFELNPIPPSLTVSLSSLALP